MRIEKSKKMNLKQAFYKDYYQGIDFRRYPNGNNLTKDKEKSNEQKFKTANNRIFDYTFKKENFEQLDLSTYQLPNYAKIQLSTIYPGLLTGIGMVHETNSTGELKLGFFFDHTSGLPMLPGSGVKGALRSAFPNFKSQDKEPTLPVLSAAKDREAYFEKQKAKAKFIAMLFPPFRELIEQETALYRKVHQLELAIFEGVNILEKTVKPREDGKLPMSKRCRFLDAIIYNTGSKGNKIVGIDALTPHGENPLKNPIPLPFLKVLPDVIFQFQFMLPKVIIEEGNSIEGKALKTLFEQILLYLGVGAKTNVGYGQFTNKIPDTIKNEIREQQQANRLATHITGEHLTKLQYHKEDHKNRYEAVISAITEEEYQLQLLGDCILTKNRKTVDNKFKKDSEKRKKRQKPFVFKVLSIGDKVTIKLNEPKEGQKIAFSILPIWV